MTLSHVIYHLGRGALAEHFATTWIMLTSESKQDSLSRHKVRPHRLRFGPQLLLLLIPSCLLANNKITPHPSVLINHPKHTNNHGGQGDHVEGQGFEQVARRERPRTRDHLNIGVTQEGCCHHRGPPQGALRHVATPWCPQCVPTCQLTSLLEYKSRYCGREVSKPSKSRRYCKVSQRDCIQVAKAGRCS